MPLELTPQQSAAFQVILDAAKSAGILDHHLWIPLTIAYGESAFDPALIGDDGHSVGLFQLHDEGVGAGMSVQSRQVAATNAAKMMPAIKAAIEQAAMHRAAGGAAEDPYALLQTVWYQALAPRRDAAGDANMLRAFNNIGLDLRNEPAPTGGDDEDKLPDVVGRKPPIAVDMEGAPGHKVIVDPDTGDYLGLITPNQAGKPITSIDARPGPIAGTWAIYDQDGEYLDLINDPEYMTPQQRDAWQLDQANTILDAWGALVDQGQITWQQAADKSKFQLDKLDSQVAAANAATGAARAATERGSQWFDILQRTIPGATAVTLPGMTPIPMNQIPLNASEFYGQMGGPPIPTTAGAPAAIPGAEAYGAIQFPEPMAQPGIGDAKSFVDKLLAGMAQQPVAPPAAPPVAASPVPVGAPQTPIPPWAGMPPDLAEIMFPGMF